MKKMLLLSLITLIFFAPVTSDAALIVPVKTDAPATTTTEAVKNAVSDFKSLSRKERKERVKTAKKKLKEFRKQGSSDENTVLLVILAILLPPLAVYLHQKEINTKFWISLLLTLLFWIPGVIYSLLVVLNKV